MGLGGAGSLDLLDRASDVPGLVGFEFRSGESGGGVRLQAYTSLLRTTSIRKI